MEKWSGIIGTLAGVIIGGCITLAVTLFRTKHEKTLERNKRVIERLEKAHKLLTDVLLHYRKEWALTYIHLVSGQRPNIKEEMTRLPWEELKMITSFYAPDLVVNTEDLMRFCQEEFGPLSGSYITKENLSPDDKQQMRQKLTTTHEEIIRKTNELQTQIAELAKKHI